MHTTSSSNREPESSRFSPVLPPLASLVKRVEEQDSDLMEVRLARLSSQHAFSDYSTMKRRTLQSPGKPVPALGGRRTLAFTPRSSMTSLQVESPPMHTPIQMNHSLPSRSNTPVYEDTEGGEDDLTPTAKRHHQAPPELDDMHEPMFAMDTMFSPSHLPPGTKTSFSHPLNMSELVPPELLSVFGYYLLGPPPDGISYMASMPHFAPSSPPRRVTGSRAESPIANARAGPMAREQHHRLVRPVDEPYHLVQHARHPGHAPIDLWHLTQPSMENDVFSSWHAPLASPSLLRSAMVQPSSDSPGPIGNLLLSSCPGKKVRLFPSEPRGGRSAICRDLYTDLKAIKSAGARAVVCCLDDNELTLLGAPWTEYEPIARELDLILYRLPMGEGLGPEGGAKALDVMLETLLVRHTLRGENVLVHCRGGVGRAALVGGAWLLKTHLLPATTLPAFSLVEKVIEVLRRRRSIKSIETVVQVKALMEYVEFLRETKGVRAEEVLASKRGF